MSENKPSRIKIGPDGSLARITSSVEENNIMIQKTDSGGLKSRYKLFTLGASNIQYESSSDESDEEKEDPDICSIDISIERMKLNALQKEIHRDNRTNERVQKSRIAVKEKPKLSASPNNSQFKNFQQRERFSRSSRLNRSDGHKSLIRNRNYNVSDNHVSAHKYRSSGDNLSDVNCLVEPMPPPLYKSTISMQNRQMVVENCYPEFPHLRTPESVLEPMMLQLSIIEPSFEDSNHSSYPYKTSMPFSSTGPLGDYPSDSIPHQCHLEQQEAWVPQIYSNNIQRSLSPEVQIPVEQNLRESDQEIYHRSDPPERSISLEQNLRNPYPEIYRRFGPPGRSISLDRNLRKRYEESYKSGPPEKTISMEQNHRKSYKDNMFYSTQQKNIRKSEKWRKNKAKNRKKGRTSKTASTASNTEGYRQWKKFPERNSAAKSSTFKSEKGRRRTNGHSSFNCTD